MRNTSNRLLHCIWDTSCRISEVHQEQTKEEPGSDRRGLTAVTWLSSPLGLRLMFHGDDHVSLLVSLLDIPMSLGDLLQRIAPIDDRL